jgi:hypothetical protein
MTGIPITSIQIYTDVLKIDDRKLTKGSTIWGLIKVLKNSNLAVIKITRKTIRVSTSTARSIITVPNSLSAGIFSVLARTAHRVISPILGNA